MAAAPAPPSGDDVTGLASFLSWVRDWGWSAVGAIGLPAAWHVSGRLTKIEEQIAQHSNKFEDQVAVNKEIKERVAGLADKDDVKELREDIRDLGRRMDQSYSGRAGYSSTP